jgi:hypothetical protein
MTQVVADATPSPVRQVRAFEADMAAAAALQQRFDDEAMAAEAAEEEELLDAFENATLARDNELAQKLQEQENKAQ